MYTLIKYFLYVRNTIDSLRVEEWTRERPLEPSRETMQDRVFQGYYPSLRRLPTYA